eukprot:426284_1
MSATHHVILLVLIALLFMCNCDDNSLLKTEYKLFDITATPSQSNIRNNDIQNISILFKIDSTISQDSTKIFVRQPNELAIVLDVSGSMIIENRIQYAKSAIKQIVNDLIDGDIFHLIVYSSGAETLFKNGNQSQITNIINKIDSIEAGGSTNMYSGLRKAYKILKNNGKLRKKMKQRVFLFSDGWVNDGDVRTDEAILNKIDRKKLKYGITTSSFGVGLDFNRPLLNNMSIVGEGDFFYIDSAERIEFVVNIAKRSYQSTIATRTKLFLFGLNNNYLINNLYARGEIEYNTAIIDINDLRSNDKKYIIIGMEINNTNHNIENNKVVEILRWKLKYEMIHNDESVKNEIEDRVKLDVVHYDKEIYINYDVMIHWELAKQRVEDIFIFEEETVNGNIENAIIRKTDLIRSLENKCKFYVESDVDVNEDTIKLSEIELNRHKLTLESLKTAQRTNSEKERQRAMLKQHSDIVRNVNSSFFHDEL